MYKLMLCISQIWVLCVSVYVFTDVALRHTNNFKVKSVNVMNVGVFLIFFVL